MGKTTLGFEAAHRLEMPCLDVDLCTERDLGMTIDEMTESGWLDHHINAELWQVYKKLISPQKPSIIVASPRIVGHPEFWKLNARCAVTVHLRWLPIRILRRELATLHNVKETEITLSENEKRAYYDYYWWRLAHFRKADLVLRLTGDLAIDAERLCSSIVKLQ